MGTNLFPDAFAVSLQSGGRSFDLLLVERNGARPDPFGTASGAVTLGAASQPGFEEERGRGTLPKGLSSPEPARGVPNGEPPAAALIEKRLPATEQVAAQEPVKGLERRGHGLAQPPGPRRKPSCHANPYRGPGRLQRLDTHEGFRLR
jgi:hypothetical protein